MLSVYIGEQLLKSQVDLAPPNLLSVLLILLPFDVMQPLQIQVFYRSVECTAISNVYREGICQ